MTMYETTPKRAQTRCQHNLGALLGSQSGFVLPTAVMVLLVVILLTAATVTAAVSTSSSSVRDEHKKASLEAAEAGLRVATYRLDMLKPSSGKCINGSGEAEPSELIKGYCSEGESEPLGNGATYKYWTTPELRAGMTCVGMTLTASEETREKKESIEQRCVTAEGVANGVETRVQERVATFIAAPLFPFPGIIGEKLVKIGGKTILNTAVASNGKIISEGESSTQYSGYCELGYKGSFEGKNTSGRPCATLTTRTPEEGELQVRPVEPGTSATESANAEECSIPATSTSELPKYNCNVRITNGIKKVLAEQKKEKYEGGSYDEISVKKGEVSYEPSSSSTKPRFMTMKGGGSWTIGAGVYNFCNFTAEGGSITLAAGAEADIYIEAPESEEPGSGCPAGSGKLLFKGGTTITNLSKNPTALKFFVYGKGPVEYTGKLEAVLPLSMTLYAPEAFVELEGKGTYTGGIVGGEVITKGEFAFEWRKEEEAVGVSEKGATTASYYRTAWAECKPKVPSTEPTSGC